MRKWLFFLLLLSACSPKLRKDTLNDPLPQPDLQQTAEYALKNQHFFWGDWPNEKWWEMFHSCELNSLVEQALQSNPNILAVQQRVNVARNEAIITRSKIFPLIFLNGNEAWQYLSKTGLLHTLNPALTRSTDDIYAALSVNYEVDIWWKYHNLYYAAMGREQAKEAEQAQVELVVATMLSQAYFALKTNLVRQKLFYQLQEARQLFFNLSVHVQERALTSMFEPALALEQLEDAKKLVYEIDAEVRNNIHVINILRGVGPDEPICVDELPLEPPKEMAIPETLSLDLLARRPDLAAAILRAKAQAFEIKAAIADFVPNIDLRAIIALSTLQWSELFRAYSSQPGLLPALHMPIFTAGAIKSGVRKNTALFNEAVQEYNSLLLKASQEVADLLVVLDAVYEKRKAQDVILTSADFRYDLASLNYMHGLDNMFNVYEKEIEWIEKALVDVELIYAQYTTSIGLIKALGGGYCHN
ncbi:MAG: efflux transporter outer membrane subunit [Chlamydiales bacterium]|nr:efflux transporter outer membrane subunit [Chlamydiales bacterium]